MPVRASGVCRRNMLGGGARVHRVRWAGRLLAADHPDTAELFWAAGYPTQALLSVAGARGDDSRMPRRLAALERNSQGRSISAAKM
jgi:hypothetical protein